MAINVNPSTDKPTHHVLLTGPSNNKVPIILCDSGGVEDKRAMVASPYPRTSLRTASGEHKYSDLELPYKNVVQDDWVGGRGNIDFELDKGKYYDGHGVITWHAKQVTLGGKVTNCTLPSASTYKGKFFQYKGALYMVTTPGSGTSQLYRNGYRGVATGGSTSTLVDSGQSWSVEELEDAVVAIVDGDGKEQIRTRKVTLNTSDTMTVDPYWDVTPVSSETAYVVLNVDTWEEVGSVFASNERVSDVAVANGVVYFAFNSNDELRSYREYNASGTWTSDTKVEVTGDMWKAERILALTGADGETDLWMVENGHALYGNCVKRARVPRVWGDRAYLYRYVSALMQAGEVFDRVGTDVTMTGRDDRVGLNIAAGFTTGMVAKRVLDEVVPLRTSTYLTFGVESTVATSKNDLKVVLSDSELYGIERVSSKVLLLHREHELSAAYFYDGTNWWPADNMTVDDGRKVFSFDQFDSTDYHYLGLSERCNKLHVRMGGTVNALAAVMAVEVWTGEAWTAVSDLSDGTASGGATLAQDGVIGWTSQVDWDKGTDASLSTGEENLDQTLYWVRMSPGANLTAAIHIENVVAENDATGDQTLKRTVELPNVVDNSSLVSDLVTMYQYGQIVVMGADKFDTIRFDLGGTVNGVTCAMTAAYNYGAAQSLTITDGTASGGVTLAQDGSVTFDPPDDWDKSVINGVEGYLVYLKFDDADLTADVEVKEIWITYNRSVDFPLPALGAADLTWVKISQSVDADSAAIDLMDVKVVQLDLDTDLGSQIVYLYGGVHMAGRGCDYIPMGDGQAYINGLAGYGDQRTNPWVFTENGPYEVQTENDDGVGNVPAVRVPLDELRTMESRWNGVCATTNDVYMYFGMGGGRVMQYYNGNLVEVGVNAGTGLPDSRRGEVALLESVPGGVLAGIDAGDGRYSSVMLIDENEGVHEFWRGGDANDGVWGLGYQEIPGQGYDRVWISSDGELEWVPFSIGNPLYVDDFPYALSGDLVVGGISADFLDVVKLWKSLKIYSDQMTDTGEGQYFSVSYMLEDLYSIWIPFDDNFDTSPFHEELFSEDYDVTGRRLFLKFAFTTDDATVTPVLKSWVLECLMRFQVKMMWSLTFRLADRDVDLQGNAEADDSNGEIEGYDKFDQISTWLASPEPVWMDCISQYEHGQYVFPEPGSLRLKSLITEDDGREVRIYQLNLLQV